MSKTRTIEDKSGTIIRFCTCKNHYQDKLYGEQHRVFNLCANKSKYKARCSVCGRTV